MQIQKRWTEEMCDNNRHGRCFNCTENDDDTQQNVTPVRNFFVKFKGMKERKHKMQFSRLMGL